MNQYHRNKRFIISMNPILRFLASLRSLRSQNVIKTIDEAYDFAKREFGEVNDLLKRQIEQVFKGPTTKAPPPGGGGITSIKNAPKKETPVQESGTSPVMQRLEKGIETLKEMKQPGMDLTTGLTRTSVRKILDRAGIQVPDKVDPIEVFEKNFGGDALMDVKDVAEEMIELERMGKSLKSMDEILEQSGMFDIKRNPDAPKGLSDEEIERIKKEVDQEKMLKDFDPTDREPNSEGGINRAMYAFGSGVKLAKFLSQKGKNLKDEIKKAVDNIFTTDDIKYDADVAVDSMLEELGVDRNMFDQKDILNAYGMAYDELKIPLLQKLKNKPVKSMESMKKTGSIDISDPEIAGEMDRFAKQADPEGYKKMEEAMKKAADEAQPIEYFLGTRKKNSKGGLQYLMGL
jgi:hypothetical protein